MATADQYASWIVANQDKKGTPEFETVASAYKQARGESSASASPAPSSAKPEPRSFLAETGRQLGLSARHGIEGVGGTLDMLASPIRAGMNLALPQDMQIRGQTGQALSDVIGLPKPETGIERVSGDIARSMAAGGGFVKGAQLATSATSGVANAVMRMLSQAPAAQVVAAGSAGAGSGLAREAGGGEGAQLAAGLAGAMAPAAAGSMINVGRAVKDYVHPSVGSLGRRAAGDKADDVIAAMMQTKSNVPGVKLTAGEASVPANSAEFAAFQKAAANENASKFYGPIGVKGQQATARLDAVRSFGKTSTDLDAAVLARRAASTKNYGDAFQQKINADPALAKMMQNPYVKDALPEALKLAKANGISPKSNLTEFMHFVKLGLDAKLQSANNPNLPAISGAAKKAIQDAQSNLVAWMGQKNPLYDAARTSHMAASKPINQMRVGQDLEQALVAPATGMERAASFGAKVRQAENTISKGSGNPRIQDLTSGQRKIVDAIEEDFLRNQQFKELAIAGKQGMEERIGAPTLPPTGFFQPAISAARSWVNKGLGTGHQQALKRAAEVMDNPQEMARLMREATPAQRKILESLWAQRTMQGVVTSSENQRNNDGLLNEPTSTRRQSTSGLLN